MREEFNLALLEPYYPNSPFVPKYFSGIVGVFRDVCVTFGGEYLFDKTCSDTVRFGFSSDGYLVIQMGDHPLVNANLGKDTMLFKFGGNRSVLVFCAKVDRYGNVYGIRDTERFNFYDQIEGGKSYTEIQNEFREFLMNKFNIEL